MEASKKSEKNDFNKTGTVVDLTPLPLKRFDSRVPDENLKDFTQPRVGNSQMKQIQMGKKSEGYQNYTRLVKRSQRGKLIRSKRVYTPVKKKNVSKRRFEGQIKAWRRKLHQWDSIVDESSIPWRCKKA